MTDLLRYDLLVQDALKGVVRRVLTDAAKDGLPGEHHFYVSFRTDHAGVRISSRLRERYPNDMTIVLQHQFETLIVNEALFEVGLSFSGIPERLRIPFEALTGFFDPSVQFGLKFEAREDAPPVGIGAESAPAIPLPAHPGIPAITPKASRGGSRKLELVDEDAAVTPAPEKPAKGPGKGAGKGEADKAGSDKEREDASGGEVVSLDAFRKKS